MAYYAELKDLAGQHGEKDVNLFSLVLQMPDVMLGDAAEPGDPADPAVGVGSLMFPELLASPVVLTSARGIRARSIAEHVIGVTIALARRLPAALRAQYSHRWAQNELEGPGSGVRGLDGLRMGIVGLGSIGMEIVRLAIPLGMRLSGIRRRASEPPPQGVERVYPPEQLPALLESSDVLVLAVPHTPETKQIIGRRELDRMPPGAMAYGLASSVERHSMCSHANRSRQTVPTGICRT